MDTNAMWTDWSYQNELYHQQLQSSYYQLQYLQQQQMMMMMRNSTSSRRSSTVSSTSSNASRYRPSLSYQPSPSTSNSSVKHRSEPAKRTTVTPINTSSSNRMSPSSTSSTPTTPNSIELPKRRQSLGKRIKKVFGMTEHGTAVADKRQAGELPKLKPVDTSFSASPSSTTKSKGRSSSSSYTTSFPSPSFMAHNTSLPASPNSSISSRYNHHQRRSRPPPFAAVEQLPSPAASTVSTTTCSSNTDSSITTNSSKKSLSFNPVIKLHETFSAQEYDRRCDTGATCQKLTPVLALKIKEELNNFKLNDMFVHMDSRQNTHFFM
ncbi:cyclin-dependent kinase 5 [Mucor velutinosus]|uniref:Cyclin-dependent kinase 5 n=1 Tax=Mucor velutinosus TaxID=708070 RepID=A0AAN7HVW0_9FUNG|nr:cyclin-dependent kinase 5 [Mucor velutinosus]